MTSFYDSITVFCPRCGMPVRMDITTFAVDVDRTLQVITIDGGRITCSVTVKPTRHVCTEGEGRG